MKFSEADVEYVRAAFAAMCGRRLDFDVDLLSGGSLIRVFIEFDKTPASDSPHLCWKFRHAVCGGKRFKKAVAGAVAEMRVLIAQTEAIIEKDEAYKLTEPYTSGREDKSAWAMHVLPAGSRYLAKRRLATYG